LVPQAGRMRKKILKRTKLRLDKLNDGTNGISLELTKYTNPIFDNRLKLKCLDCNQICEIFYNIKFEHVELNGVLMSIGTLKKILFPLLKMKIKDNYIDKLEKV
jgi:hypothetical protein